MTEAEDLPVDPIGEMSPIELEIAHPESSSFKVRNLEAIFTKAPLIPRVSVSVPFSPAKGTR